MLWKLLSDNDPGRGWMHHAVEDDFTGETRQYVDGWGESYVLFLVASCDAVAIAFANRGSVFENGRIEAIWDDGEIVQYEAEDLDSRLVLTSSDWMERMRTSTELRVRVNAFENRVASDTFDLTDAELSPPLSGSDHGETVDHLRELFSAIGCGSAE